MVSRQQQQPDYEETVISDCESSVSSGDGGSQSPNEIFSGRTGESCSLIGVNEEDRIHSVIKQRFVTCLQRSGLAVDVVAVHQRNWSAPPAQATLMGFNIHRRAIELKSSSNANVKFAWFGTSKTGVEKIIGHGFSHEELNQSSGDFYGRGIYLSPNESPLPSVRSSVEDEDGLRHVLLCKVLLGNAEPVTPGSDQTHPSSDCFDSGVDNLVSPKKYIVWSSNMNTHILPKFVISFRETTISHPPPPTPPASPWMPFPALIEKLSCRIHPRSLSLISKYHNDFKAKRITRDELVRTIRLEAGDKLLAAIIKSC